MFEVAIELAVNDIFNGYPEEAIQGVIEYNWYKGFYMIEYVYNHLLYYNDNRSGYNNLEDYCSHILDDILLNKATILGMAQTEPEIQVYSTGEILTGPFILQGNIVDIGQEGNLKILIMTLDEDSKRINQCGFNNFFNAVGTKEYFATNGSIGTMFTVGKMYTYEMYIDSNGNYLRD